MAAVKDIKVIERQAGAWQRDEVERYNQEVRDWGRHLQSMVKANAEAFREGKLQQRGETEHTYKRGKKAGRGEKRLVVATKFRSGKKYGEIEWVGLTLPVHGIFREYGVGRETPHTKVGMTKRTKSDWLSREMDGSQEKLVAIVAEHDANKVIRLFRGVNK